MNMARLKRCQPWVQQWGGQGAKTPTVSATMSRGKAQRRQVSATMSRQTLIATMNKAISKVANLVCNNKRGKTQRRQPWVQHWAGQDSKTLTLSATMSRARLKDANLECNNVQGKTQRRQPWVQQWTRQDSKTPALSATMSGARLKRRQPWVQQWAGKTPALSATMSGARLKRRQPWVQQWAGQDLKDASLECNNERGKT